MKRKLFMVTLVTMLSVCLLGGLTACNEKHTHAYTESVSPPTCTAQGFTTYTCECGDAYVDGYVESLEHTVVVDAAVEATCSMTGLTEGSHCSVCNAVIVAQEVVAKKSHTASDWLTDTEATCSVLGAKHKECAVCHTVLESGTIDKLAHTPAIDAAVEATCSMTGLTEGSHCSVCNAIITAQEVVAKKDHTIVVDAAVEATCNSTGLTEGNHCSVCNATLVAQRVTSKLTHNLSVKITDIPETCTEDGTYYIECTLCYIILERGTLEGGHNYEATVVAPTASAQGYTQHVCSRCNDTYTDTIVPALGFTGLAYVINEDERTCTITGLGSVTETEIAIPLEIDGYKVTAIGDKAFENCTHLTKILLQDSITTIGTRAFYGCTGLTEFTIPQNVTKYGSQIFYKATNLNTIYYNSNKGLPENAGVFSYAHIKKVVFCGRIVPSNILLNNTNIQEVTFNNTITEICEDAFMGCTGITSVFFPESLRIIGDTAFKNCTNLRTVYISKSITELGVAAFRYCTNLENVYISDLTAWCNIKMYSGYPDSNPLYYAPNLYLNNTLVTNLEIPEGVTSINLYTFYNCKSITSLKIPNTVKKIESAFSGCTNIDEVYIDSIESWLSIKLTSSPLQYADKLYINDELVTALEIPDSVTLISDYAFYNFKGLNSVYIPESVSNIGKYAFSGCTALSTITIEAGVTEIGDYAFENCASLISITIPDSISAISSYMFFNCTSITNIIIPDSVTRIGQYAFLDCTALESIKIPCSVSNIDETALMGCSKLTQIELSDENQCYCFENGVLYNKEKTILIKVLNKFSGVFTIQDSVKNIGHDAFYDCANITSVVIPVSVIKIGSAAFVPRPLSIKIVYNGTIDMWNSINIYSQGWGSGSFTSCTIYCNDGTTLQSFKVNREYGAS